MTKNTTSETHNTHKTQKTQKTQKTYSNKNSKETKPTLVIGKIHAKWCGHCVALVPEWNKMKSELKKLLGNKYQLVFAEIEQSQEKHKLPKINSTHLANSSKKVEIQGGYPTLFKIHGGKLDYYGGERQAGSMTKWFSNNEGNVNESEKDEHKLPLKGPANRNENGNRNGNLYSMFHMGGKKSRKNRSRKNRSRKNTGWFW